MGFTDSNNAYHAFQSSILPSLYDFREVDANGDVGAITANGGLLASDTTPAIEGVTTTETQQISWVASNSDIIAAQFALPAEFDGTRDVILELWVSSGTTNAATFTVETSWNGGTLVSDTCTDGALSATVHKTSCTISAADIPDSPSYVTLMLTPAAHTTNAINLFSARILYVSKSY